MKKMAMERVGRTWVLVHAPGAIPMDEWSTFVERMKVRDYDGLLVWTPGAAPNSPQRNSVRQAWGAQLPRVAVVTDSSMVKGVLAIFALFMADLMRGFLPTELDAAMAHLAVPDPEQARVVEALARLRAEVGVGAAA